MLARKNALSLPDYSLSRLDPMTMGLAISGAVVLAAMATLGALAPTNQVLPLLSLMAVAAAAVVALATLVASRFGATHAPTTRSVSKGFLFAGLVSGMLSGSSAIIDLFGITG